MKMALAMAIILSVGSFLGCQMFGGSIVGLFIKRDSLLFDSSVAALRKYSLAGNEARALGDQLLRTEENNLRRLQRYL